MQDDPTGPKNAAIALDRDTFLRDLLRTLAGTLEETVGVDGAAGYVSVVGDRVGRQLDEEYRRALDVDRLDRDEVAEVLVDLKRRIEGDFHLISVDDDKIVLGNRACPFAEHVIGRPSLCMMTSNVFGSITAENLGYAGVELQETIAQGASGCKVVVHLTPESATASDLPSREYFGPVLDRA